MANDGRYDRRQLVTPIEQRRTRGVPLPSDLLYGTAAPGGKRTCEGGVYSVHQLGAFDHA